MANFTPFGGVSEIGGNKILIEDKDARIMLDFGMSISGRSKYFSDPYSSPRSKDSLLELGIIPRIDGLYSWEGESAVDALFLTHAHLDHYGYLSMVNRAVPVHCGETTETLMRAITTTKRASFETDYSGLKYVKFRTGSEVTVGSITLKPVHVDHSIPGAYGFIVETSSGTMVYTGDLRAHGRNSKLTEDFVSACSKAAPQVLLTEATNLVGGVVSSEEEVKGKLVNVMERAPGLIMASFSTMDADRLHSFYTAAKQSERKLALSMRQAYLLHTLEKDPHLSLPTLRDDNVVIYKRNKQRYESWEEEVCSSGSVVNSAMIAKEQRKYVLAASLADMEGMVQVRPEPGSVYILSSSEPFNEEMELDNERLIGWLDFYGMPLYHIHVSGHIMPQDLRELVSRVNPKSIVPIHTERPQLFSKFVVRENERVAIPRYATPIEIG